MLQPLLELCLLSTCSRAVGATTMRMGQYASSASGLGGRVLLIDVVTTKPDRWSDAPEEATGNSMLMMAKGEPLDSHRLRNRVRDVAIPAIGEAYHATSNRWLILWSDVPISGDDTLVEYLQ